jgi:lysozyme
MFKRLVVLSLLLIISSGLGIALLYYGILHLNNPSRAQFPVRGIDVSHHQGVIDWQRLPRDNVQFAYLKATEGGDFKDPRFQMNWRESAAAGIPHGAYHYFSFCRSGLEQARNFIASVPVEAQALPPVVDLEPGACEAELSKTAIVAELKALLGELQRVYDKPPMLYVTKETYQAYVQGDFPQTPLWVRDVYHEPHWLEERTWAFWQYDSRTRMDGISTYVDMNVWMTLYNE